LRLHCEQPEVRFQTNPVASVQNRMAKIYIGTSGWMYKDWHEAFYPEEVPQSRLLEYYASQFATVEINATFYRLATENAVASWRERAPRGFVFAVKGSRFITHIKRLKSVAAPLAKFLKRVTPLGKTLGPILWQCPPTLKKDIKRLRAFTQRLPETLMHAVEFRHRSWMEPDAFDVLRERNIALVWVSSTTMPQCYERTANFVYLRFHGLAQGARHNYTRSELESWADKLVEAASKRKSAYVYFNNDVSARAPANALLLRRMVGDYAAMPKSSSYKVDS
jgi:uncharacterized protein YecE (DUF72 family)